MTPEDPGPILLVHNHYQQRGGEDRIFEDEARLLTEHGHEIHTYTVHNDAIRDMHPLKAATSALWNRHVARDLARLVRDRGIRIAHFHNTFPLVSPAAYRAVRGAGAATVQTLHNYRLLCANAQLTRDGTLCEACLNRPIPWPALCYRCYRQSLPATAVLVAMQVLHRGLGTWIQDVDAYIALTEGAKARFAASLLPAEKIHVLGNFLQGSPEPTPLPLNGHTLFIGRLDQPKGLRVLLDAWAGQPQGLPRLMIAGAGPMAQEVQQAVEKDPRISWAGFCTPEQIGPLLEGASFVLLPSVWLEGFPLVLLEAWAAGRPVLASRIGALDELISDGQDGWLVPHGDPHAWALAIANLHGQTAALASAGAHAVDRFRSQHNAQAHYRGLLAVYRAADRALASEHPLPR
jgi:glycosyltransferase involved in cell wall biosynthesis